MKVPCPECGKVLDSEKEDFLKHARTHYGCDVKDIYRMRNQEAQKRYKILVEYAEKAELEKDQVEPKIPDVKEHIKNMEA
jgi:hypothetical protein